MGLLLLYLVTLVGGATFHFYHTRHLAKTYANSVRNELLLADYRQSMVILGTAIDRDFYGIEYFDYNRKKVFDLISDQKRPLLLWSHIQGVSLDNKVGPKLVFLFNPLGLFLKITMSWLAFCVLSLLTLKLYARRLEELYKTQSEKEKLLELGKVAHQIAHDIRSPLSALRVLASINGWSSPQHQQLFEQTVERMGEIANDVLKFRFKSEHKEIFKPRDVISKFLNEKSTELASAKEINLKSTIKISPDIILVGDASHFHRVLSNIVNNSVEACGSRGNIVMDAVTQDDQIIIEIQDDGSGFTKSILKNLFRRGFTSRRNGNGLGLHHAKEVIESWGGKLSVDSVHGQGTSVKMCLPIQG